MPEDISMEETGKEEEVRDVSSKEGLLENGNEHNLEPFRQGVSADEKGEPENIGFLELIYGVIFEPVKTFRFIGKNPPILKVLLIFVIIQTLSMLLFVLGGLYSSTGYLLADTSGLGGMLKLTLFGLAFGGFVFGFVKWFFYSGILFFLSQLLGGKGKAMGALAATGLASIPAMLLSPVQLLFILWGNHWWFYSLAALFMLGSAIWFVTLLVIGLKETQHLSGGKALAVIVIPVGVFIGLFILFLGIMGLVLAPLVMFMQQFGGMSY